MLYASSRDALRRSLVGIAAEVQGTAFDEISEQTGESHPARDRPLILSAAD